VIDQVNHGDDEFPPETPLTIWDPIHSRSVLSGLNPLSEGVPFSLNLGEAAPFPKVKYARVVGQDSSMWYFVNGKLLQNIMQLSFRQDGTQNYVDIGLRVNNACDDFVRTANRLQNLAANYSTCVLVESGGSRLASSSAFTSNGMARPLADTVRNYIDQKTLPVITPTTPNTPSCEDKSNHDGVFFLHLFDSLGREFYLPMFRGSWNLNHYWAKPPAIGCFHFTDTIGLNLIE
jgi:hypothetical protein